MNQIELKHKGGISKILVNQSCHYLTEILDEKDFVVITDTNLIKLYQDFLWRFKTITIPAGEQFKKLSEIEQIYQKLIDFDVNREHYIVGFGGGVICDIAGFIASTFMRGMKLINIPTTLLAQTDSDIGGKNGVNFLQFKNVIGTYHQPDYVICDINLLKTLPEREIRSSLAESIKAGLVYSEEFFEYFEKLSSSNLYANNFNLISLFSVAASITRSASTTPFSRLVAVVMEESILAFSASVITPFSNCLSALRAIICRALFNIVSLTSIKVTRN